MKKGYIIYDGRAMYDTDEATVFEACMGGKHDLHNALDTWAGHDAVLVEYDSANRELTNERIIGHLNEGKDALLAKCS